MTFDDILDQVITLLKRQGRVSYGAMKRRFDLDDAYLEDLKGEILFAYPVVDEDGRGLVWTGEPLLTAPPLPDAAKRQLTVMFCDVVDSTKLSGQLDPEEYRDVLRAYQSACVEAIQRFDGYIAQHLGDGLLVLRNIRTIHGHRMSMFALSREYEASLASEKTSSCTVYSVLWSILP